MGALALGTVLSWSAVGKIYRNSLKKHYIFGNVNFKISKF